MATQAQIEAAFTEGSTTKAIRILRANVTGGLTDYYYCVAGVTAAGRARWCATTAADSGADQAAAILVKLRAT